MKILFLSTEGSSYPLAAMMMNEGHEVLYYSKSKDIAGEGFVEKVDAWEPHLEWCDYVICDFTGWGKINDAIRKVGKPVVGGTAISDALEEDRSIGQKMFKAVGMDTLPSRDFTSIEEATKYVLENPRKYVMKLSGKAQMDKSTTYVGQMDDGSDIPGVLEVLGQKGFQGGTVELQDAISGVEVAVGGFFNGEDFLDPICVNMEHKKLMNGGVEGGQPGLGCNTAEMGTYIYWRDKGFKLYKETIGRFVEVLKKQGYRGYFDINCIVHEDYINAPEKGQHVHPLEMTNRLGWPLILLQMETMKINDLGELFYGIATGECEHFSVSHPHSVCVVLGCPPLPYKDEDKKIAESMADGMPILFKREGMEGIYPGDCYCEDGQWKLMAGDGYACIVAAGGDTIEEARMKAYEKARNVIFPNKFYRTDIAELCEGNLQMIKGFLEFETEEAAV